MKLFSAAILLAAGASLQFVQAIKVNQQESNN